MPHRAFITNNETKTLKKRLEKLIEHSKELKFLVGFFYFSGYQQLYNSLKNRDDIEIKILAGLSVDRILGRVIETSEKSDNLTTEEKAERFFESVTNALNDDSLDKEEFYQQVEFFIDLTEEGKLHIKKQQSLTTQSFIFSR